MESSPSAVLADALSAAAAANELVNGAGNRRGPGRKRELPTPPVGFGSCDYPRLPDLQLSEIAQPGPGAYALSHRFSGLPMKKYEGSVAFAATVPRFSSQGLHPSQSLHNEPPSPTRTRAATGTTRPNTSPNGKTILAPLDKSPKKDGATTTTDTNTSSSTDAPLKTARGRNGSRPTTTQSSPPGTSGSGSPLGTRGSGGSRTSRSLPRSPSHGLSSLVSKSNRFPANLLNTEAAFTPPPGTYNPPSAGVYGLRGSEIQRSRDGHGQPSLRAMGVFVSRSDRNSFALHDANAQNPLVGPGSYNPPARGSGPPALECVRPFKSITPRFVRIINY